MSGTTYDWSPLFDAINNNVSRYSDQNRYQAMIDQMMGKQVMTPGSVGMPQLAALPSQLNATAPQIPGAPAPRPVTANMNLGGQAATPGTPGGMGYDGPAGQALGASANTLLPMLRNAPPSMGFPLLLQSVMKNADRQQKIADSRITPIADDEAQQLGLRKGGVYGRDLSGNVVTIQPSDMKSTGAMQQVQDEEKFKNALPMNAYQGATVADARAKNAETARHDRATEAAGDVPPDANTVKYWAQSVAAGGPMPTLGMGKQAAAYRQAILKDAASINSGKGMSGIDQNVANATTKANTATLTKQTQLRSATEGFENTMLQNMNVVRGLLAKGAGNTGIPIANRFERYVRGEYAGDPDVVALNNALDTVADENAKIRSGTLGNTPATDAMRGNIRSGLNGSMTTGQIEKAFSVMEQDAGNRSRSLRAQEDALKHGLQGKSDTPNIAGIHEPQSDPARPPANIPAGWTLHADAKGNKAYVSPDGKQFIEAP